MEPVTPLAPDANETVREIDAAFLRDRSSRILTATATFRLSEEGRKQSLLAGGNGRERQEMTVDVPTNRMHLVTVDADGHARLRLSPRYSLNADQRVIRHDEPPMFDAVPSLDDLLKEAARNHQLQRAYRIERAETRQHKQDRLYERHQHIAEAFLADPTQRARVHPRPTKRRCDIVVDHQVFHYDTKPDQGIARQVPPEAYRRFCADQRARVERGRAEFDGGYAVHQTKERLVADWVARRGSRDQQERHAAGLLPVREVLDGMAEEEFRAAGDRLRYVLDGVERLQAFLRQIPRYATVVITKSDLRVMTARAEDATEAQWRLLREMRALFPNADVTFQRHRLGWAGDPDAPTLTVWTVLLRRKIGPFNVRRELLAPQPDQSLCESLLTEDAAMAVFDKPS